MKGYIIYNGCSNSHESGYIVAEDGVIFRIWWFRAAGGRTLSVALNKARKYGVETFMSGKKIPFIETEILSEEPEWVKRALNGLRR